MLKIQKQLFITVLLLLLPTTFWAQDSSPKTNTNFFFGAEDVLQNCEINSANIYMLRHLLAKDENKNSVFILIARLGQSETRGELNQRRLFNVKQRLALPLKRVLAAEGESVNGLGRIEIYWNGRIIGKLFAEQNRDVCVDCCGPDKRYYPDKGEIDDKQKQKFKPGKRN